MMYSSLLHVQSCTDTLGDGTLYAPPRLVWGTGLLKRDIHSLYKSQFANGGTRNTALRQRVVPPSFTLVVIYKGPYTKALDDEFAAD
jgi:hypothetical protein